MFLLLQHSSSTTNAFQQTTSTRQWRPTSSFPRLILRPTTPTKKYTTTTTTFTTIQQPSLNFNDNYFQKLSFCYNKNRSSLTLKASSSNNDSSSLSKKMEGRKKRVIAGYRLISLSYIVASLLTMYDIHVRYNILLSSRMFYGILSGPLSVATYSYILISASINNRLNSDTYKRMNITLILYSIMIFILTKLYESMPYRPFFTFCSIITFINSIKGYGYGIQGGSWETKPKIQDVIKDLLLGIQSTLQIIFQLTKNIKSIGYKISLILVGLLMIHNGAAVVKNILLTKKSKYAIAHSLSEYTKSFIMTSTAITLQDASNRNRLNGTTFIELNWLQSILFTSLAGTRHMKLSIAAAAVAINSATNAILSIRAKKTKKE